ncbi:MAG: hypothetical protein ACHBN1_29920 [Heteroscytonema crispum UTEX LB 1556]
MGAHQVRIVLGTLHNFRSVKTEVKTGSQIPSHPKRSPPFVDGITSPPLY